jgi:hypothetical protein
MFRRFFFILFITFKIDEWKNTLFLLEALNTT